jgi:hypothetical protein
MAALRKIPKPIVKSQHNVQKRLLFADSISYTACLGYNAPSSSQTANQSPVDQHIIISDTAKRSEQDSLQNFEQPEDRLDTKKQDNGPVPTRAGLEDDFLSMIDDMASKVWTCQKCLSFSHEIKDCPNKIRCRACYNYGHIKKNCLTTKLKSSQRWIRKQTTTTNSGNSHCPNLETPDATYSRIQTGVGIPPPFAHTSQPPPNPVVSSPSQEEPGLTDSGDELAVFEVDPTPWLPWGHHIIDGGATRLPRSYYFPTTDPPQQHQAYCIAVVEPAPPQHANGFWREQVSDFLTGPLQRNVIEVQPSLFDETGFRPAL